MGAGQLSAGVLRHICIFPLCLHVADYRVADRSYTPVVSISMLNDPPPEPILRAHHCQVRLALPRTELQAKCVVARTVFAAVSLNHACAFRFASGLWTAACHTAHLSR
jgi:hypothetical protein